MTQTVLLTLDGSDKDERAISIAAALVELADAAPHVLRVFESRIPTALANGGAFVVVDTARALRDEVDRQVRDAAARLAALVSREVVSQVVDGSDVAATLLDEIERHDPDFVVMATRAAGPVGRAIHGSVADRLVRESPRPVVLVPPRASYLGGRKVTLRRVLVPLDGSAAALRVIPRLLALPRANLLELVLLQVVLGRADWWPVRCRLEPRSPASTLWTTMIGHTYRLPSQKSDWARSRVVSAHAEVKRRCGSSSHGMLAP